MFTYNHLKIVPYSEELREHIKVLNYEWLEEYFKVEEVDRVSLSNPVKEILDKGGHIFYVEADKEIVGTAALLKISDDEFELGKMAVTKAYRGQGIGKFLLEHTLEFAKAHNIKRMILYSNRSLKNAIHLYANHGFVEEEVEPGHYDRANIKMALNL